MGFDVSYLTVIGKTRDEALVMLGLRDTGERVDFPEHGFTGAVIPAGYLVFSQDFEWVMPERIAHCSKGANIVAVQVHEGTMISVARFYHDGAERWSVTHVGCDDPESLEINGKPPAPFDDIRARFTAEIDEEEDKVFEIPVETARAIFGFRYDLVEGDWGAEPHWTTLAVERS